MSIVLPETTHINILVAVLNCQLELENLKPFVGNEQLEAALKIKENLNCITNNLRSLTNTTA